MSISFILSITPWAFKEAVIACIGGKVSLWVDFIITILGSSYHLWNPLIFYYFHQKFRTAVKEYVEEEIFCHRGHLENGQHSLTNHQYGVANLLNNVRPLMITSA